MTIFSETYHKLTSESGGCGETTNYQQYEKFHHRESVFCWMMGNCEGKKNNSRWSVASPGRGHQVRRVGLFELGEETAAQAVAGSIVWAICRLENPRCREIAPAATRFITYAPNLTFFFHLELSGALKMTLLSFTVICGDPLMTRTPIAEKPAHAADSLTPEKYSTK